jgi:hypothetical protein
MIKKKRILRVNNNDNIKKKKKKKKLIEINIPESVTFFSEFFAHFHRAYGHHAFIGRRLIRLY